MPAIHIIRLSAALLLFLSVFFPQIYPEIRFGTNRVFGQETTHKSVPAPIQKATIIKKYPHDPRAFTQGLVFANGFLYESTGISGKSSLRKVELESGHVIRKYDLAPQYFGEGLAIWDGSLIQLTWKSGKGFVYDTETFALKREFQYQTEGWGIAGDGKRLVMSNGSENLIFLDPKTFALERSLRVLDNGRPVVHLNELEFVRGEIFANIWLKDIVARISPETGEILGWLDMSPLRSELPKPNSAETLNGIAFDAEKNRIFVTGKFWPILFEIETE